MAGLRRLCKAYGGMKAGNTEYVWDYAEDEPVKAEEMPVGSDRWKASERAKFEAERAREEGVSEFRTVYRKSL